MVYINFSLIIISDNLLFIVWLSLFDNKDSAIIFEPMAFVSLMPIENVILI